MQTKVMGVLRVVPDAFADGDRSLHRAAVARGRAMIAAGADIVEVVCAPADPGRRALDAAAEARTVAAVVEALAGDVRVAVAPRAAADAAAALAAGATLVAGPATAPDGDPLPAVAAAGAGWVAVHDAGGPARAPNARTPGNGSGDGHSPGGMIEALSAAVARASAAGVEEIYVDPGIGGGRAVDDDLDVLAGLDRLSALGRPLVVGTGDGRLIDVLHAAADARAAAAPANDAHAAAGPDAVAHADDSHAAVDSNAGGEAEVAGRSDAEAGRLEGALAVAVWAMLAGAAVVRTHHVAATVEAARIVGARSPVGAP